MDKREFYRFNVELEARYRVLESLKPYELAITEDVCEKGIKIKLPEYVQPNTILELTINIPGEPAPIMVIGKVVWSKKDLLSRVFTTGIYIIHIKEEDKQKFYKYAFL